MLFGFYLVVQAFVSVGMSFSAAPLVWNTTDASQSDLVSAAGVSLGLRIVVSAVFLALPGVVFILRGPAWADRVLPDDESETGRIEFVALLAVGCILLGANFVLGGLTGAAAGWVAWASADDFERPFELKSTVASAASLLCGVVTILIGRRVARSAA